MSHKDSNIQNKDSNRGDHRHHRHRLHHRHRPDHRHHRHLRHHGHHRQSTPPPATPVPQKKKISENPKKYSNTYQNLSKKKKKKKNLKYP
ncbi:hypothetical protein Hanom_Chr04g00340061 [Helianthus anomalus]